jgi:YidC/Oxa1 family membrane protein insertase
MKGRLFLPLMLIGLVILVTPILFPGKPRVAQLPPTDGGVTAVPAVAPSGVDTSAAGRAGRTTDAATPRPREAVVPAVPATPAETAVVATPKVRYRVASTGGALVGAEMLGYHQLGSDSTPLELSRGDAPLLSFHVVAGGDSMPLDGAMLSRSSTASPLEVSYRGTVRDVPIAVTWSFAPDTYRVAIDGVDQPVAYSARLRVTASGLSAGSYLIVRLPHGFQTSEVDSATDFQHLAYAYKLANGGADLIRFGSLDPGERDLRPGPLSWAVAKSKYFLVGILAPPSGPEFVEMTVIGAPRTSRIVTSGRAQVVVPFRDGVANLEVYVGPQEWRRLVAMGREFETANPYGGFMQGLVQPFATIVIKILLWMKDVLELNYGWTLIIFGVLIRVVLWPLNQVAMRASMKMQRIQPELAAIQKKYANNREKLSEEMMKVYRAHGMSPFSALSGCLPLLIPMPVLFALFFVFQNTIEFRGVPFWWMTDISQKDPLFIIPIAMGLSMFAMSWVGMRNVPPNPQSKILLYVLPIMMTVFFITFAAGLNLYYTAQNIAALPQQWLISNERARTAPKTG